MYNDKCSLIASHEKKLTDKQILNIFLQAVFTIAKDGHIDPIIASIDTKISIGINSILGWLD